MPVVANSIAYMSTDVISTMDSCVVEQYGHLVEAIICVSRGLWASPGEMHREVTSLANIFKILVFSIMMIIIKCAISCRMQ